MCFIWAVTVVGVVVVGVVVVVVSLQPISSFNARCTMEWLVEKTVFCVDHRSE